MADDHIYVASDINPDVKAGNAAAVEAKLNADYINLQGDPKAFTAIVNQMTQNDPVHPLDVERDKDGNVTAINMTTWHHLGFSGSDKVFEKKDQNLGGEAINPVASWGATIRALSGANAVTGEAGKQK